MVTYTTEELADLLKTNRHMIGNLKRYGIIKGMKIGKNTIYSEDEVKEFLQEYRGADLSNPNMIQIEYAKHKKR